MPAYVHKCFFFKYVRAECYVLTMNGNEDISLDDFIEDELLCSDILLLIAIQAAIRNYNNTYLSSSLAQTSPLNSAAYT
jgi:hypothetical protein